MYQPRKGEAFSVELKAAVYQFEWFDPAQGASAGDGCVKAPGGEQQFETPSAGEAVLYLKKAD